MSVPVENNGPFRTLFDVVPGPMIYVGLKSFRHFYLPLTLNSEVHGLKCATFLSDFPAFFRFFLFTREKS